MVAMDQEKGGGLLWAWQHHQVTDSYPGLHVRAGIMFEVRTHGGGQKIQVCLIQGLITEPERHPDISEHFPSLHSAPVLL